jgi:hypothetical protein
VKHAHTWCETCAKTSFRHKKTAEAALKTFMRTGMYLHKPGRMHVYLCPNGNGWHFGHTTADPEADS